MLQFNSFSIIFLFCCTLFITSCGTEKDGKINIRAFYYPIDELEEPLVYEYQPVSNDTLGSSYWYFRTLKTDTATYFMSNIYNQFLEVEQFSIEEEVSNGMLQTKQFIYAFDTTGQQLRFPAEIEYGNAFPFEVKDSTGVFLQKMKWTYSHDPLHTTTLIRNKRYIGERTYTYKNVDYEAIAFSINEVLDDDFDGHLETKTSGIEIFAKGLGLVYYKKNIGGSLIFEFELKDTYSMEVLEKKFELSLSTQE